MVSLSRPPPRPQLQGWDLGRVHGPYRAQGLWDFSGGSRVLLQGTAIGAHSVAGGPQGWPRAVPSPVEASSKSAAVLHTQGQNGIVISKEIGFSPLFAAAFHTVRAFCAVVVFFVVVFSHQTAEPW